MRYSPRKDRRTVFVFLLFVLSLPVSSRAQGLQFWNAADPMRPWATEVNPALMRAHHTQVSVGMKIYHLGFLQGRSFGIREHRINGSFPYYLPYEIALGADLRYFTAGMYAEWAGALLLSREMIPGLSLGLKVGFEHRGFRADSYQGVDPNDPLLSGGTGVFNLNLGFGAFWEYQEWMIGLGVDHANKPNIGLEQQFIYPREISLSIGYRYGPVVPTVLIRDDGRRWRFGFSLTATKTPLGSIRFGYESSLPVKIEAQLNLNRDSRLDYSIDLPREGTRGASAGIQELVYTHILAREPEISTPEILFSTRELRILQEMVIRSMSPDLSRGLLESFRELRPEYLEPRPGKRAMMTLVAGPLSKYETAEGRYERWRRFALEIARASKVTPGIDITILANSSSLKDAQAIRRAVTELITDAGRIRIARFHPEGGRRDLQGFRRGKTSYQRRPLKLSADQLEIQLKVKSRTRKTKGWTLEIKNHAGAVVARFQGRNRLPGKLIWDWRDENGDLVPPGEYYCDLRVITTRGKTRHSVSPPVRVVKINRKIMLKFQRKKDLRTSKKTGEPLSAGEL